MWRVWRRVPEGVDAPALIKRAMDKYQLEIAGGLGPTAGKVRGPLPFVVGDVKRRRARRVGRAARACACSCEELSCCVAGADHVQVFRIGILGFNAKPQNIELVVQAFRDGLKAQNRLK